MLVEVLRLRCDGRCGLSKLLCFDNYLLHPWRYDLDVYVTWYASIAVLMSTAWKTFDASSYV